MRLLWASLILLLSSATIAETLNYRRDIEPNHFNEATKRQYPATTLIDYDTKKHIFDFYVQEPLYLIGFSLTREQADKMMKALDTYREWNKKALEAGVMEEKRIVNLKTKRSFFRQGRREWSFGGPVTIEFDFFSLSKDKHQFVIHMPKLRDNQNNFSFHKPDSLYFHYEEAMKLRDALSAGAVKDYLISIKKWKYSK